MNRYIVLLIAFVLIPALELSADDSLSKYSLLAQLSPSKQALPVGCEIAEIAENDTPVKGLKNRSITTDPKAFVIGDERLKNLLDPAQIEAMYLGLYKEKNELGVFAWAFKTEDAAKTAHRKLAESYAKQPRRFRLWQVGNNLVWLWRDPGTTDACFRQFETFIQGKIKAFSKEKAKTTP